MQCTITYHVKLKPGSKPCTLHAKKDSNTTSTESQGRAAENGKARDNCES